MATVDVLVPKVGMTTEEVEIRTWMVSPGQQVTAAQEIVEIESEKTTLAIEAGADGTVIEIIGAEGDQVAVGSVICRIETGAGD